MSQNINYPSGGKHLLGLPTSGESRPASIMTTTFRALERFVSDIRDGKNAPTPRGTASPKRRFRLRPNSCGEVDPALVIDVGVVECSQDEGKVEVSHVIIGGDTPTTEMMTTMDDTRRFQVVQEGHRGDEMDNPNLQKREGEQQEEEQPEEQQGMYPLATDDDEFENNQQHEVGYREAYGKLNATSEGCTAGNYRADIGDGMGYADSSQRLNAISPEQLCCKSVGEGTNVKTSIGVQPLSHHERHRLESQQTYTNFQLILLTLPR